MSANCSAASTVTVTVGNYTIEEQIVAGCLITTCIIILIMNVFVAENVKLKDVFPRGIPWQDITPDLYIQ